MAKTTHIKRQVYLVHIQTILRRRDILDFKVDISPPHYVIFDSKSYQRNRLRATRLSKDLISFTVCIVGVEIVCHATWTFDIRTLSR